MQVQKGPATRFQNSKPTPSEEDENTPTICMEIENLVRRARRSITQLKIAADRVHPGRLGKARQPALGTWFGTGMPHAAQRRTVAIASKRLAASIARLLVDDV